MAKLEEFDNMTVRNIQNEINIVLMQIGELYGINLELSRIKYNKQGFKGYIEAQTVTGENHGGGRIDNVKRYQDDFLRNHQLYGMEKAHLGQNIVIGGKHYTFAGLKSRATKHKFVCKNGKGRLFRFNTATIKNAFHLV
jgi:hypothetical protein